MKRALLFTSAVLATAGFWGERNAATGADASAGAQVGSPAPGFELPDVYGKVFKLADFKGRIVVL
ncbi:MAG: thioredoxin family protein, partial [Phycisphaerae bacterium]